MKPAGRVRAGVRRRALLRGAGVAMGLALAGAAALPAAAQEDERWGYALAHELMSPFCPGRTLAQCPSPQAEELRIWILTQEAAGASREEVEAELLERYGEQILSAPRARGIAGISAYAIPIAAVLLGAVAAWVALRRLVGGASGSAPPSGPEPLAEGDDPLAAEVDRDLREIGS